ncbi:MAG TPA: NIPSNAP family protein [Longimicrobiales bacterium]|nr:NIPSNAP family protein [Longimicrobiales bacterium]
MKRVILVLIIGLASGAPARAQQPPAACGPAGQLSSELSSNVGSDARCFELRMYTATNERGDIDALHQRFREQEVAIFERHGAEVIAVWQRLDDPNTLVWMLAYRDRAHRDEVWAGFAADPDWAELRQKYDVSLSIEAYWMSSTDYSNLK